ncbi:MULTISPECIES: bacteriohemerythrin [Clostridium]|jgi:hemerythrin|uniref:Hemerythrin-like metal-binding protein n=1 Tax=Clostridium saccharoperbutylacetonicum N1-4(HMT) TaxID=931276 RepID=M1MI17_9CLOT|nr:MULTISPECIES: hemerythrin family protein [Clostridium]AGF55968.1 hemerythrin-like metal-binding protein [Clostridium saccharoperbutylacetonicum N1-4(HMT)]AQR94710.1 bacteriohemerythrin [Clostridium saccharoperbutylacetonicum]NRT63293.1 hemerythrin [Clostridium saccharoperbutylacetonicum]NSB26655.1 hemerythrin [Clostridium saccharoperbutylacetonicum]NSB30551.1 hemerythrin [Clostridium saccharoperbutylacetonicum]
MEIKWDQNLAVGVDKIDNQHKELFDRMNKLILAMKEGKGKTEVMDTLKFLEDYVVKHFNEEEELQKRNNYPKYETQHKEHEEFKMDLNNFKSMIEKEGLSSASAIKLQNSMSLWWRKHIKDLDMDLGKFLMKV